MSVRQKSGGRKKGTPNKATADIRALAQVYAPAVLVELARIAAEGETEAVRISAGKELLDRGFGKAPQAIEHTGKDGAEMDMGNDPMDLARRVAFILTDGAVYYPEPESMQ